MKSIHVNIDAVDWVKRSKPEDTKKFGDQYGIFRKVLKNDGYGLTIINRFFAPEGKAWKVVARAGAHGEEVFVLKGAYYDTQGQIVARPGDFMYNPPTAVHGAIVPGDCIVSVHWTGGRGDDGISTALIDFLPKEMTGPLEV